MIDKNKIIPWEQDDGSVVDKNLNHMSVEERLKIIESVESLPASRESIKDDIFHALKQWGMIFLVWETGSGKSTTMPVYMREKLGGSVVVTQPRVLTAMEISSRISQVLLAQTGDPKYTLWYDEIWYRTGAWNSSQRTPALSLNTDGTEQVRQLFSGRLPTNLMIDEVHGKTIAWESLLHIAKNHPEIPTVLSSATLEVEKYQDFFKSRQSDIPIIHIPGRTFPITEYYHWQDGFLETTQELAQDGNHTYLFASGKSKISEYISKLRNRLGVWYEILPFHRELSEQEKLYALLPPENENITRIIVGTNIGEEGLTIFYLNAIVDTGTHKVSYINGDGIQELCVEDATLANTQQRKWRVGRTQIWKYHRHNDTPIDELYQYPAAAIENSMLEKEILLYASAGKDLKFIIAQWEREGAPAFPNKINPHLLKMWYERLIRIWGLDELGNITPLGEDLLKINLNVYEARMIIEAIKKRDCLAEIVTIAAIFSVNWFLSKDGTWNELKPWKNKESDIFTYVDLYNLAVSKRLSKQQIQELVYHWIDKDMLSEFEENTEELMLFEIVELEPLGIKNHKIQQIHQKITTLKTRLSESGIHYQKNKKITARSIKQSQLTNSIYTCIAAGYPFFIFDWDPEAERFLHADTWWKRTKDIFSQAATSTITPQKSGQYVGIPFIIWKEDLDKIDDFEIHTHDYFEEEEKIYLLSHITEIQKSHIDDATLTQQHYRYSVFPKRKLQKSSKKCKTTEEVDKTYMELIEADEEYSTEDFMKFVLPILVMSKNSKFKKFLIGKNPQKFIELRERLSKFFIWNKDLYQHRISLKNISKTQKSFAHDADLYRDFRTWEKHLVTKRKKLQNRGATIQRTEKEQVIKKSAVFEKKKDLAETIWRYKWISISDEKTEQQKELFIQFIGGLEHEHPLYRSIIETYNTEIGSLTWQERQAHATRISHSSNTKSNLRHTKTKISQVKRFLREIEKCIVYCETHKRKEYHKIDFDILRDFFTDGRNQEKIPSKTKLERYYKSLKALGVFYRNTDGDIKVLKSLERAKRIFVEDKRFYEQQQNEYEKVFDKKVQDIEELEKWKLKTRQHLLDFFSSIYTDDFFVHTIERRISGIMSELITENNREPYEIIHNHICRWWVSPLKKTKFSQELLDFQDLCEKYDSVDVSIQKLIIQYDQQAKSISIDDIEELGSKIENKVQQLQELKKVLIHNKKET